MKYLVLLLLLASCCEKTNQEKDSLKKLGFDSKGTYHGR